MFSRHMVSLKAVNFSLGFGCNDKYSVHEILKNFDFLPTGRPLAGNTVKIFDDANNEQPEQTLAMSQLVET